MNCWDVMVFRVLSGPEIAVGKVTVSVWWRDVMFSGPSGGVSTIRETQVEKDNALEAGEYAQSACRRGVVFDIGGKTIHVPAYSIVRIEYDKDGGEG